MKQYLVLSTGEDKDDTGIIFIPAKSADEAFVKFLIWQDLYDDEDGIDDLVDSMLEDNPIGIAEVKMGEKLLNFSNPSLEWYYSYNNEGDKFPELLK